MRRIKIKCHSDKDKLEFLNFKVLNFYLPLEFPFAYYFKDM